MEVREPRVHEPGQRPTELVDEEVLLRAEVEHRAVSEGALGVDLLGVDVAALDRHVPPLCAWEGEEEGGAEATDACLREEIDRLPALLIGLSREPDHEEARCVQVVLLCALHRVEDVLLRHVTLQHLLAHARAARLDAQLEDAAACAPERRGDARVEALHVGVDDEGDADAFTDHRVTDCDRVLRVLSEEVVVEEEGLHALVGLQHVLQLFHHKLRVAEAEEAEVGDLAVEVCLVGVDDAVVQAVGAAVWTPAARHHAEPAVLQVGDALGVKERVVRERL